MTIGIIAAMQKELDNLQKNMTDVTTEEISGVTFYRGHITGAEETDIVAAVCGVGKVFAAVCAQTMILKFQVDRIVNIGVAGSVTPELKVYDVVVADQVCQHDMNTCAVGDPIGLISGINVVYIPTDKKMADLLGRCLDRAGIHYINGTTATGDIFVDSMKQREHIRETFGAASADMEGASIGQVCYINQVPFAVLRSISDADGAVDYMTFAEKAAQVAIEVIVDFVRNAKDL